ncbi:MAG: HAMP domain-containing protein [Steroidobacteraceae bacterium]|nr:HAMP domain-containing protein [Deltaproteobacteria bacterium]
MTAFQEKRGGRRRKSLRRRMVVSLLSLALLPLAAAMVGLFFVVGDYAAEIQRLQPASRMHDQFIEASIQAAFLLSLFGAIITALAWRMADQFLRPILKIRRGAEIVARINLGHRIELDTGDELEDLAREFNRMAENLDKAYDELGGRVREATRTVQEERNRLATVLRTMVDGVIVANEAAETILMNPRARIILDLGYTSGIGAPLARILPGDRLGFHLKRVRQRWEQGRETVEDVLFPLLDGKLLKGSLSIVPGPAGERYGFLLVFRDLNSSGDESRKFEETLREMPQLLRGPLATSRSLIETLQRHREMPAEKQMAFLAAVAEEISRLSERVSVIEEAANATRSSRWPAIPSDPRDLLMEALLLVPGTPVEIEDDSPVPAVLVEPFSWVASLCCVLQWIRQVSPAQAAISANLREEEGSVVTTFRVRGPFKSSPTGLESREVGPAGEQALTLGEAVRRNRGELWTRSAGEYMEVRLALLQTGTAAEGDQAGGLPDGEPEFYDFDLFLPRPVVERADQLQADLNDLEYVVFDTETTGLRLSEGDKIISISGVRIRRGRIQNAEIFHSLVNPGRSIPAESVLFHHIEDHMVAEAPSISLVYPQFAEFVGDSILVAHNAAFDRKCLEIASAEAGVPLIDNPILDTLFLSYGLHQGTEGHGLDALAERMGITIEGRHTSLGDARATAQVFLGLISLLPQRGVRTLAEAKAFCDRQLLLRWQSSRF